MVNHVVIDINSTTGLHSVTAFTIGLSGLPAAWEEVLKTSDISKEEIVQNGTALLDVLRFHFNGVDNKFDSIPYNSLDKQGSNGFLYFLSCSPSVVLQDKDPAQYYQGLNHLLGEGAFSAVYSKSGLCI